jgi:hypothetical protein
MENDFIAKALDIKDSDIFECHLCAARYVTIDNNIIYLEKKYRWLIERTNSEVMRLEEKLKEKDREILFLNAALSGYENKKPNWFFSKIKKYYRKK